MKYSTDPELDELLETDGYELVNDKTYGLSIREYMATQILQGFVSNPSFAMDSRMAAKMAKRFAEHLIEELNGEADESAAS